MFYKKAFIRIQILLLLSIGSPLSRSVFASLQVFPTRVVLTDKHRVAQLTLTHTGTTTTTYQITPVFFSMLPNGTLKAVKTPAPSERSAEKLVHFSPREITLQPGVLQVFKVLSYLPKDLPEGEYRIHLNFAPLTADTPIDAASTPGKDSKKVAVAITTLVAVAIPIVVKHGKIEFKVSLSNLKLVYSEKLEPEITVDLSNSGNGYPWGTFNVFFTPFGSKEAIPLGKLIGISNYNYQRSVRMPLEVPKNTQLKNGTLRLTYTEPKEESEGGGESQMAEITVPIL